MEPAPRALGPCPEFDAVCARNVVVPGAIETTLAVALQRVAPLMPIGSWIVRGYKPRLPDAGVPVFSPHDLRHRRISLLHHEGVSWAEIGARVGQRNISTTADTYTHVLMDYREIDRPELLARVRTTHPGCTPPEAKTLSSAATF